MNPYPTLKKRDDRRDYRRVAGGVSERMAISWVSREQVSEDLGWAALRRVTTTRQYLLDISMLSHSGSAQPSWLTLDPSGSDCPFSSALSAHGAFASLWKQVGGAGTPVIP